jgi:hypothetical protein
MHLSGIHDTFMHDKSDMICRVFNELDKMALFVRSLGDSFWSWGLHELGGCECVSIPRFRYPVRV